MLVGQRVKRIWIAQYRIDFRKSFDGLMAEAYRMGLKILEGDAVLFISRDKKRLKVLFSDRTGLLVCSKRFHDDRMSAAMELFDDPHCLEISEGELMLLIEGTSFTVHKKIEAWPEAS
jgi:hypothetical protein